MLMDSVALLPGPALCSPLTPDSGAQSKHENTPKAELTGEPITMGRQSCLTVRSVINDFFFFKSQLTVHMFTNLVKLLRCLRSCLFTRPH